MQAFKKSISMKIKRSFKCIQFWWSYLDALEIGFNIKELRGFHFYYGKGKNWHLNLHFFYVSRLRLSS